MYRFILLLLVNGWSTSTQPPQMRSGAPPAASAAAVQPSRDAALLADLRADINRVIRGAGFRSDRWGVIVVSLTRGDTLYALEPDLPLAPASNAKLFTSATALYYLGADFRFNTFLLTDGAIEDGILKGDLVLYGTGDPTFSDDFGGRTSVFESFADSLTALGIREIQGEIVGDASYFRGPGTARGWQENYIDAAYAAPASALSFAENIATVRVQPAERAGWRPVITLIPGGEGIAIVNQAMTTAGGRASIQAVRSAYEGPLTVQGRIPRTSRGVVRSVPVSDPPRYAAAVLREILMNRGIVVSGGVRSVQRAEDSPVTGRSVFAPAFDQAAPIRVLAVHNSPPLLDILTIVNKRSHNMFAEQSFRAVGRVAAGEGSVEGGARAVRHLLAETSADTSLVDLYDGSGLSALNRVTARSVVQLLAFVSQSPIWDAFWSTLPEAGAVDGLRRMQRTSAEHNLRAKTGTLNNVSALSGYVRSANGEQLAFSILANNVPSTWKAKRVEDAIGARLASFSRPALPGDETNSVEATAGTATSTSDSAHVQAVTTPAPATTRTDRMHTIRAGDTLDAIARKYGVTVKALQAANPKLNPGRLLPGSKIILP
jgi:D-alanyl-D-alanine carboxypeptidase/D-alanyl-D-alanine-endopeptidase (penicillin-binding protein 4)